MYTRGIRGAITIENDSSEAIKNASVELFSEIIEKNSVNFEDISHVIFTMTPDLKSAYPAKFIREHFDIKYVPLVCMNEMDVENSLKKCLRVLLIINTEKKQDEIKHIYLREAKKLRTDLAKD